jgi:hypothetical protein
MAKTKSKTVNPANRAAWSSVLLAASFLVLAPQLPADSVILHLKNGDRVAGDVVTESNEALVVDTSWAKGLRIPRNQIASQEAAPAPQAASAGGQAKNMDGAVPPGGAKATAAIGSPSQQKTRGKWNFDAKLGADMIRGERDRDIYYGDLRLRYARPYASNAKKFLRNELAYHVDYGTTDGQTSANRMFASDKTDLDIGEHAYAYNSLIAGYDEVRRINGQIEAGPGLGVHLWRSPAFAANAEGGLTYQFQDREDSGELESLYARLGQDCTWKVYSKITFSQRSSLLASLEDTDQLQFRLEANLSFGIVQNLSLNLTAVELYDTRPASNVTKNEFQLRSSLGISF